MHPEHVPPEPESLAEKELKENMEKSLAFFRERGGRPDKAVCHFRYAEILAKFNYTPLSREQLDQATTLFREMEMTWWLEQAEALGKELGAA